MLFSLQTSYCCKAIGKSRLPQVFHLYRHSQTYVSSMKTTQDGEFAGVRWRMWRNREHLVHVTPLLMMRNSCKAALISTFFNFWAFSFFKFKGCMTGFAKDNLFICKFLCTYVYKVSHTIYAPTVSTKKLSLLKYISF